MGFVSGVNQHPSRAVKHQRLHPVSEDGFLSLGEGGQREAVGPTVFFKRLLNGAEVRFPPVDEQEVRPLFLSLCPTDHDFLHHPKVVECFTLDDVFPVLLFCRTTVAHDHACTHTLVALQLRHVKTDDVVKLLHPERFRPFVGCSLFE